VAQEMGISELHRRGRRRIPESNEGCVAKLVCNEGVRVLATILPLLRNVASTPVGWLICRTVRSIETPLITYPSSVPSSSLPKYNGRSEHAYRDLPSMR
jgi:hypothetical protein